MINGLLKHTSGAKGNDFTHLRSALMSGIKLIGQLSHRRAERWKKGEVSLLSAAVAQESRLELRSPMQSTHPFSHQYAVGQEKLLGCERKADHGVLPTSLYKAKGDMKFGNPWCSTSSCDS